MPVDICRVRWDAEVAGTSYLMVVVMGKRSESMSLPTVDQALLTTVTSGVLGPRVSMLIHVAVPPLKMLAFWGSNQSSTNLPHCSACWWWPHSREWALSSPPARQMFPGSVKARARVSGSRMGVANRLQIAAHRRRDICICMNCFFRGGW